jgi:hypothetical protein
MDKRTRRKEARAYYRTGDKMIKALREFKELSGSGPWALAHIDESMPGGRKFLRMRAIHDAARLRLIRKYGKTTPQLFAHVPRWAEGR